MIFVTLGIDPTASHVLYKCSNSELWVSTHGLWFSLLSLHAAEGVLNLTLDILLLEGWLWWPAPVSTQRD